MAVDNGLAYNWNGAEWTAQLLPSTNTEWSEVHAVSCSSETECTAVGNDGYPYAPLAERWNGTEWTIQAIPALSGEAPLLDAVSCPSATACMAVGEAGYEAASEKWNGAEWTIEPMPNPGQGRKLVLAVSCTGAAECTAVGTYYHATSPGLGWTMFAERWNGTAWALQATPNPVTEGKATEQSRLYGVSCYSATACTAVGTYSVALAITGPSGESRGLYSGLAEHWNGTTWSQQVLPGPTPKEVEEEPKGVEGKDLASVSCVVSATSCTAVGVNYAKINSTLAEHWNGTAWSLEATPTPGTPGPDETILDGVSCPSLTVCVAFGFGDTANGLLAEVDPPEEVVQRIREAETRHREVEGATKRADEEKETNARKVREEEEAASKRLHEEKVAALKTSEEKEAAEQKYREEEASTRKANEETEAARRKTREAAEAPAKTRNEENGTGIGQSALTATTSSMVPFTLAPSLDAAVGTVKRLTKAQKVAKRLKACKKLSTKKRLACESRVRGSATHKKK